MASNRRIRGDCGSVGTPIERDPENQADFPTTPMLPLIESPDTDALFTWARNMTMSLEDWFNLLSQAVYDGDDQLTDLYECYCIRLCNTTIGVPCIEYSCDALETAILAAEPWAYYPMRNGYADISTVSGQMQTGDLMYNQGSGGPDLVSGGGVALDVASAGLLDNCAPSTSYESASYTIRTSGAGWPSTGTGTIVCVIRDPGGNDGGSFGLDGGGGRMVFNSGVKELLCQGEAGDASDYIDNTLVSTMPNTPLSSTRIAIATWSGTNVKVYDHTGEVVSSNVMGSTAYTTTPPEFVTLGFFNDTRKQDCAIYTYAMSQAEVQAICNAALQNLSAYIDPAPGCGPAEVELVYADGDAFLGYPHQNFMISAGITTTGSWIIDPQGYGKILYTRDNGATFENVSWNHDSSTRLFHGVTQVAADEFVLMGYRPDNRDTRFFHNTYTGPGSLDKDDGGPWLYLGGNSLAYCHGYAIEGRNIYFFDTNNNGLSTLHKWTGWPDATVKTKGEAIDDMPGSGTSSMWHSFVIGDQIWTTWGGQGGVSDDYGVANKNSLASLDSWNGVLYDGRTAASSGSSIYSTGRIFYGGTVGPVVEIQKWNYGPVTSTFITFPEDVDHPTVHFENGRYIVTAQALSNTAKIYYYYGIQGTVHPTNYVISPYPENYVQRDLRYIGGGEFLFGCVCTVGAQARSAVFFKSTLSGNATEWVEDDPASGQQPASVFQNGITFTPTPVNGDIMKYDSSCGGWTFVQDTDAVGTTVYFQVDEPLEAVEGDFWSTTVSQA